MQQIQEACEELQHDHRPAITFIVVQKRHHARFFPISDRDKVKVIHTYTIIPCIIDVYVLIITESLACFIYFMVCLTLSRNADRIEHFHDIMCSIHHSHV